MFDFFNQLFRKQVSGKVPMVQEMLQRSDTEQLGYTNWQLSEHKASSIKYLHDEISRYFLDEASTSLLLINTAKSRGFILPYNVLPSDILAFQHLFDYFKAQILTLNYSLYLSDVKHYNRPKQVETIERHYLKPRMGYDFSAPLNQLYGNITIEHYLHNDKPQQIKFLVTPYNDRKYTAPLSFAHLVEQLLG